MIHPDSERPGFPPKNFLPLVAGVFLVLYAVILAIQWFFLHREAVRHAEKTAVQMAELLRKELENSFPLPTILEGLSDPGLYEYFDRLIRDKLSVVGLLGARIYTPEGKVVYATDCMPVGSTPPSNDEVFAAANGEIRSEIIDPKTSGAKHTFCANAQYIETYLPLENTGRGGTVYVFEAYQDFSATKRGYVRAFFLSAVLTGLIVGCALGVLIFLYRRVHRLEQKVEVLESFLPICASCKKIRVEEEGKPQEWVSVEQYFEERQSVAFSHGLCDECLQKLYPDLADGILNKEN